ncbi:diacylglycerol/lipid kinase family protein [Mycobacterium xenopi]|uniref:Diacylglycerol kinase n=1 Tax=Mycobacterium xenopi TaxID=1789 RepID=A0AAD1M2X5_MYCXE|nr:diacylglycerol kinase family protein [Mycobacterium xenopi]MDA3638526.1 diacylglycerol kinase family protein [Mycobacterium xenopi]MDA3656770.1 diacylglycerol kinase family protein [Mycobacterium xenopi]MDA3661521.1 diacylglycerol kinase family protein [Mycobacterium xenopi]ORX17612.1 diacylglycerol kinase [Mycobacterium xenopi]SPX90695.1 diacylglycerol kinase catalytic subunit [Mycobacterium xenopi]
MRAVLIVNPTATSTTPAGRDLLAHALRSRLQLTIEHTTHRGHGGEIAQAAAEAGVDVVVVHGGDGTVSNVVNGLLGRPGQLPTGHIPALAVVPGGSANVAARSLGISPDPIIATNQLIGLLDEYGHQHNWRRIGVIDCGERWAVLNAGMGVDAEVVAAVEAQREKGVKVTPLRYWRVAVPTTVAYARREPTLTLRLPGRDPIPGVHFVWVTNTNPWTYSNNRPLWTNPGCTFESGLGVFGLTSMKVIPTLRLLRQMLSKRPKLQAKQLIRDDDAPCLEVTCTGPPIASQFDGDYLGLREHMTFRSVPDALAVVAPPAKARSELRK